MLAGVDLPKYFHTDLGIDFIQDPVLGDIDKREKIQLRNTVVLKGVIMEQRQKFLLSGVALDRGVDPAFRDHHSPKSQLHFSDVPALRFHGRDAPRNKDFCKPCVALNVGCRVPIRIPVRIAFVFIAVNAVADGAACRN